MHLTNIREPLFAYDECAFLFMVKNSNYAWGANIDSINLHIGTLFRFKYPQWRKLTRATPATCKKNKHTFDDLSFNMN